MPVAENTIALTLKQIVIATNFKTEAEGVLPLLLDNR